MHYLQSQLAAEESRKRALLAGRGSSNSSATGGVKARAQNQMQGAQGKWGRAMREQELAERVRIAEAQNRVLEAELAASQAG